MKTLLTRVIPLLLCILTGFVVSWVAIYAFWFGVWIFHTVPAARAFDAVGRIILTPARLIYRAAGGDQSTPLFDPISYVGTNGLFLGIVFYSIFRNLYGRWERNRVNGVSHSHAPREKVESR
ncbi:MAG TPA: hypothetical protein VHY22_09080 [Chthoniobacteraceae bacterium]|nr:hypothetical protein [Chthoniobacteraceae bacterium]